MQLYALDKDHPVLAQNAQKHLTYQCPECRAPVRVRGGPHRQTHFYHLRSNFHCDQHRKTLVHLKIQDLLHAQMPGSVLEKSYPEIGRIADVSWEKHGLIFEIQYSSISLAEAKARCEDYAKLRLNVVWILHDARFNKRRISDSEAFLRQNNSYYTNIDAKGQGLIYDQFDISKNMLKVFRGPPLRVELNQPKRSPSFDPKENMPQAILSRLDHNRFYFKGDLIDQCDQHPSQKGWLSMAHLENKFFKIVSKNKLSPIFQWIKDIYTSFLNCALESSAK